MESSIFNKLHSNISKLPNEDILYYLQLIEQQAGNFYRKELQRLEKEKAKAIITDLKLFKKLDSEYNRHKNQSESTWIKSWKFYKILSNELKRRKLKLIIT